MPDNTTTEKPDDLPIEATGEIVEAAQEAAPASMVPRETRPDNSPVSLAIQSGADPEQLLKFMELQERWEANEAKKAYMLAVAEFKSEYIHISRDMENKQFGSRYSSKSNLINTVNPYLSAHGLNARFDIKKADKIEVTCILTHKNGHSESVSLDAPPDKSGSKNPIQEIKSTITYLEIITFEAITGVSSSDGSSDDDGNGAGGGIELISDAQLADLEAKIEETGANAALFCKACGVDDLQNLPAAQFQGAIKRLEDRAKQRSAAKEGK